MSYELSWVDEQQRTLSITLTDPLTNDEIRALRDFFLPLAEQGQPLFMLLDVQKLDLFKALQQALGEVEGEAFDRLKESMLQSRVAVIGGGGVINLVEAVLKDNPKYHGMLQKSKDREEALIWLREVAAQST